MVELWQLVVAALGIALTVVVSAFVLGYRIGRTLQALRSRIDGLNNGLAALRIQMNGHLTLLGTLIRILHRRKALDDQEFSGVLKSYTNLVYPEAAGVTKEERRFRNPLTTAEADRLDQYIGKAQGGEFFTPEQVQDYNALVKRLEQEKPSDPRIWALVALGAFLLGLYLGAQQK